MGLDKCGYYKLVVLNCELQDNRMPKIGDKDSYQISAHRGTR